MKRGRHLRVTAAGLVVVALMGSKLAAAPVLNVLLTNGPVANRLNVTILAEGYTASQQGKFLTDATNALQALLAYEPFLSYRTHCNAFAIAIESNEEGSDHPAYPQSRDTYFNSTYDLNNHVITIPPDGTGLGRVLALVQQFVPECELPILLVNDGIPGGSGGPLVIASHANGQRSDLLVHEVGHTLGRLGDEYDYVTIAYGYPPVEYPNTTTNTQRQLVPWKHWIAPETPVPTPVTLDTLTVVGLFEGANYTATGWYRPKFTCLMRDAFSPFCEVCQEALVLAVYQSARPVESRMPVVSNMVVTSTNAVAFDLTLLQPRVPSVTVQWLTNDVPVPDATNATFRLLPAHLGNGTHVVAARVHDQTVKVRNDPDEWLRQTVTWTVGVQFTELHLGLPRRLDDGGFSFRIAGQAAQEVVVQGSSNLIQWVPLDTNRLANGEWLYTNRSATSRAAQFFRAATPP